MNCSHRNGHNIAMISKRLDAAHFAYVVERCEISHVISIIDIQPFHMWPSTRFTFRNINHKKIHLFASYVKPPTKTKYNNPSFSDTNLSLMIATVSPF